MLCVQYSPVGTVDPLQRDATFLNPASLTAFCRKGPPATSTQLRKTTTSSAPHHIHPPTAGAFAFERAPEMDVAVLRGRIVATLSPEADLRRRAELDLKSVSRPSHGQGEGGRLQLTFTNLLFLPRQAEEHAGFTDALLEILQNEQEAPVRMSSTQIPQTPALLLPPTDAQLQRWSTSRTASREAGTRSRTRRTNRSPKMRRKDFDSDCCQFSLPPSRRFDRSSCPSSKRSSTTTSPTSGLRSSTSRSIC